MTTTDTTVNNLIINTMTQAQYSQITPSNNELYLVTDSTITSSEVTMALGYTPANTTLSNLGATSSTNFDGQWVYSYSQLETTATARTFTVNLGTTGTGAKNYLPADNYSYLVQLSAFGSNSTSTAATLKLVIGNDTVTLLASKTGSQYSVNAFFIVVDSNRTFDLQITTGFSSEFRLSAIGYRRLGTNT